MTTGPEEGDTCRFADRRRAWRTTLLVLAAALCVLAWLLARLIWLPFLFGLFFFLVAGLLVGAVGFRVARRARPVPRGVILRGVFLVSSLVTVVTLQFEYLHARDGAIGEPPRFAAARNAVLRRGESIRTLFQRASVAFDASLRESYPPGRLFGYVRWALDGRGLPVQVDGQAETITNPHGGMTWPARTVMGWALLAAGLWASLESLRSAAPVSNILQPGEPYVEDDE